MVNRNNVWVSPSGSNWKVQRENSGHASRVFGNQSRAESYATKLLKVTGGGERVTQGRDGQIRSKDTIARRDPIPPRDTEH